MFFVSYANIIPRDYKSPGYFLSQILDLGVPNFHLNPFATNLLTGSFPLNLLVYEDIEFTCFNTLVHSYNLERVKWSHKSARPFMTDISVFYFRLENIKHRT